jgi:hypothetical protein
MLGMSCTRFAAQFRPLAFGLVMVSIKRRSWHRLPLSTLANLLHATKAIAHQDFSWWQCVAACLTTVNMLVDTTQKKAEVKGYRRELTRWLSKEQEVVQGSVFPKIVAS